MLVLPLAGGGEVKINPGKIIAVGLNYRDHVKESGALVGGAQELPAEPVLFAKTPNTIVGPGEAIVIPSHIKDYKFENARVDPECELAVIIGKTGKRIPQSAAFDYVLGFTCYNDVSQRNIQRQDVSGWFRGKSFDTFGPVGPAVVPLSAIGDPQNLNISCKINGELKQSGNTRDMIFSIPFLISYISNQFTLNEGDIIATGTPAGVSPIVPGDIVEVEIEKIGVLKNPVAAE